MKKTLSIQKSSIFFLLFTFYFSLSYAQPGTLDKTFGTGGTVYLPSPSGTGIAKAALQEDNKIVTIGYYSGTQVTRFLENGIIDSSFGENGQVTLNDFQFVECIAIQKDGKILVGGTQETGNVAIKLKRFMPDGSLDPSFGENGIVTDNLGGQAGASGLAIQDDDKILVTGFWSDPNDQTLPIYASVAKYNDNGSPDVSFGNNGNTIFKTWVSDSNTRTIAVGKNGKIYIGGDNNMQLTPDLRFFIGCVKPDGKIDSSFDGDGMVFTNVSKEGEYVSEIAVQEDGKIVATGTSNLYKFGSPYSPRIALVRYNTDGSLDKNLGTTGIVEFSINNKSLGNSIALQKNGKILIGGLSLGNDAIDKFSVTRFLENGSLDSSFGTYGYAMPDFVGNNATSVLLQNDGRIVLAGEPSISLTRYLGDPTHPIASRIKRWIKNHTLHFEDNNSNADYYAIEQQTSTGVYKPIGEIPASAGMTSSAGSSEYSFALPQIPSTSLRGGTTKQSPLYRIKAVASDGSFTYFDAVAEDELQTTNYKLQTIYISPNPATNFITISGLDANKKYEVRILDKGGIQMYSANPFRGRGINISSLQTGLYFIKINDGQKEATLKFIKQ